MVLNLTSVDATVNGHFRVHPRVPPSRRLRTSSILERHPVASAGISALAALIVVDAARRSLVGQPVPRHPSTDLVLCLLLLYSVAVFASARGRSLPSRKENSARQYPLVMTAFALTPVACASGAGFLGAAIWTLWLSLGVTYFLLAWWLAATLARR